MMLLSGFFYGLAMVWVLVFFGPAVAGGYFLSYFQKLF